MWTLMGLGYVVVGVAALISIATSVWIGIVIVACLAAFVGFAWVTSDGR